MEIQSNESNLTLLREKITGAKAEVLLCSGWITSGMLRRVIDRKTIARIQKGEIKLRILIRLGDPVDVKITDPGVFKFMDQLGEHASLRFHASLHAKMFVVDNDWALMGSFNLTGGGFGTEDYPGKNPEAGFEFTESKAIRQVRQRFDEIWNHEDVHPLSDSLLGFVVTPSEASQFWMLGIRDLPLNHFIQIKTAENEYIIGKVVESQKQNLDYYNANIADTDPSLRYDVMDSFGRTDSGGQAKALARIPSENLQLKLARIKINNKVVLTDKGLQLTQSGIPVDVASEVHTADKQMLEEIFNHAGFSPAVLFANRDIEVGLDPVELTTKHFSVFGSTGSGKSYFVKQMLANNLHPWYCKKQKGRIIIFDPHDEYNSDKDLPQSLAGNARSFETIDGSAYNSRLVRDIDDLEEAINLKFASRDEKSRVDRVLRESIKASHKNKQFIAALKKEALQESGTKKPDIEKELARLSPELDGSFYQYLAELKELSAKIVDQELESGAVLMSDLRDQYDGADKADARKMYVHEKLLELYGKLSNPMQRSLKEQVINKNITKKLEAYFKSESRLISEETVDSIEDALLSGEISIEQLDLVNKMNARKVYRVDLAGIHEEDIRHKITASILTQIFEEKKEKKDAVMNTLFVIEEAHNFAPEGGGKNNPAARIIQKIAAEGRKFNLGLIVITQRPAQVSKGVLSQCSTQAIFRLINQNDLNQIKEVVEGVSEAEVNLLPQFETGQAIFSGVGIRQPVIVKGN